MRPWNDLVHVIYWAASSFRACTLRLPSVAFSSPLSSLKLSAVFTASALTMPRRTRSWIRRSSSAARRPAGSALRLCSGVSALLATPDLATIPPRDGLAEPRQEPQLGGALPRGEEGGGERGRPHCHLAPPGDCGERPRPLHRLPDEAEVVERAVAQRLGRGHPVHDREPGSFCQVLCIAKALR